MMGEVYEVGKEVSRGVQGVLHHAFSVGIPRLIKIPVDGASVQHEYEVCGLRTTQISMQGNLLD